MKKWRKKHSCYDEDCEGAWYEPIVRNAFIAGAKWQAEQDDKELSEKIASAYQLGLADKEKQMMKEAVEGKIIFLLNGDVAVNIGDTDEYKLGQKVRIIIVKE